MHVIDYLPFEIGSLWNTNMKGNRAIHHEIQNWKFYARTLMAMPSTVVKARRMSVKYGGKHSLYLAAAEDSSMDSAAIDAFWRALAPPRIKLPAPSETLV